MPKEKRVYVDEVGFDTYLYRKYGNMAESQKKIKNFAAVLIFENYLKYNKFYTGD